MKKNEIEIIDYSSLKTLSITVTEEIKDKYLEEFLQTNIFNSKILISPETKYYYKYIESSFLYEVIVFQNKQANFILEPLLLANKNSKELFITPNYFVLFENQKIVLFKEVLNATKNDVLNYLKSGYRIEMEDVTIIDDDKLDQLKIDYQQNPKLFNIKFDYSQLYPEKSFHYFKIFFILSSVIFVYLLSLNIFDKNILKKKSFELLSLEKKYKNLLSTYNNNTQKPIDTLQDIFKYIELKKINVEYIDYKNGNINLILVQKSKKVLLDFISMQNNTALMKTIKYYKKKNIYKMEISIEI